MSTTALKPTPPGIFRTATRAWTSAGLVSARRPVPFLVTAAVAVVLAWVGTRLNGNPFDPPGTSHPGSPSLAVALSTSAAMLLLLVARSLLFAPLAIVTHRFVLLGADAPGLPSRPLGTMLRFACWSAALQFADAIPTLLQLFHVPHPALGGFVVQVVVVVVTIRLAVVFPAVAIEAAASPAGRSWRRTRRHFWRTLCVLLLTALPLAAITGLALWGLTRPAIGLTARAIVASPLLGCLDVPLVATAAAASWLFIGYRGADDPGIEPRPGASP